MKSYKFIYTLLVVLLTSLLTGCRDDELPYEIIGEGETSVSVEVKFEPIVVNVDTRSAGSAISDIESLSVIVYDSQNNFVKLFNKKDLQNYNYYPEGNTDRPIDNEGNSVGETDELPTARATFSLPNMPYGNYKFYAVANMGDLTENDVKDIEQLKKTQLTWQSNDISKNNQMFGYFTKSASDKGAADGFEASPITINKNSSSIHAWIKRAASKVTIAFDPSGLNQSVWIYIHDVSIRDIPLHCSLGADNTVNSVDELLNPYDAPLKDLSASSKIIYDNNGELAEGKTDGLEDFSNKTITKEQYTQWLTLAKGSGIKGSDHSSTANALYFYENIQGDYSQNHEHDKIVTEQDIWDNEGECSTKPGDPDFKNGLRYGTYIEVTAYYVSENPQNVTQGKIKYRFMLGKDDSYNFDAQRNHHYKLTLGFDGWANQPLWNIEYYEQEPGIYLPDQFDVSYLYNQKHMLPIKIVGECSSLKVEIVENNWAPYDPSQSDEVPLQDADGTGMYRFQWNKPAWANTTHTYHYRQKIITENTPENELNNDTFFGFLALSVPVNSGLPPKTIVDKEFGGGDGPQTDLKNYYDTNGGVEAWNTGNQGKRSFTKEQLDPEGGIDENGLKNTTGTYYKGHNGWQVTRIDKYSKMLHIPVFTRNKSMILGSGFSGNNPYESFKRKAVVRVTAKFPKQGGGETTIVKHVPVLQTERIVNPKGIWHKYNDNTSFKVQLMKVIKEGHNINGGNYFETFKSTGAWKAYIEVQTPGSGFLSLNEGLATDTVYGDTDTPIEFTLKFKGVNPNTSECAVVRVDYNGYNCVHKLMVRQGYMTPMKLGSATWSSFSLYKCTTNAATTGSPSNIEVELTVNPLALGTFFKRNNTLQGIRIINNNSSFIFNNQTITGRGPLEAPGTGNAAYQFVLTNGLRASWSNITSNSSATLNSGDWGTFKSTAYKKTYRLPTKTDFESLNDKEFGFGVLYTDGTTETARTWEDAYGYQAPNNLEKGPDTGKGARGVIVYDRDNANQIFFPVGKNGMGRRTQWWVKLTPTGTNEPQYYGVLRYGDTSYTLNAATDFYRPVPYNLPIAPGAVYWLNKLENNTTAAGDTWPTSGWDMNYFNFDFNAYPDNAADRRRDARPIKLVVTN